MLIRADNSVPTDRGHDSMVLKNFAFARYRLRQGILADLPRSGANTDGILTIMILYRGNRLSTFAKVDTDMASALSAVANALRRADVHG